MPAINAFIGDFESPSGNYWKVTIESSDTGFAVEQSGATSRVDLTFRSGLFSEIAGQRYRFSRVCYDDTFAGVNLSAVLQ